jgi:hypothetical protein
MKCAKHSAEAIAVCAYCGRALCPDCIPAPAARRMVCSDECGTALSRAERGLEMILQKSVQGAKANALYCYMSGALSAGGAVAAHYMLPSPFLIWFTAACAVAFIISGLWFTHAAKKAKL